MTATLAPPKRKRTLPIDQTAAGYTAKLPAPTRDGWDGPALRIYDDDLARQWDAWRIEAAVLKSEAWWRRFFARERVPADTANPIIEHLHDWTLGEMMARLAEPDAYSVVGEDETTVDAEAEGLTVQPLVGPRERRPKAILPGCQRLTMIGGDEDCPRLRRPSDRLCPACEVEYLKIHRRLRRL